MTRMEAEVLADALREYIDVMVFVASIEDRSVKSLQTQRLAFEKVRDALIQASRHG